MRNNASLLYSFFLVVGDFLAILAAFAVAYVLRFQVFETANLASVPGRTYLYALYSTLPIWILIHGLIGLYRQEIYEKRFVELGHLLGGAFLGTLAVIGYNFMSDEQFLPGRLVPVYGFALSFVFLAIFRQVARALRQAMFSFGKGINNVLFVGSTPVTFELIEQLGSWKESGYRVLGIVGDPAENTAHKHIPVYPTFETAAAALGIENINSVIQTELYSKTAKNNEILTAAQENHIAYRFVPGNAELFVGNIQVDLFRSVPVIAVHQTALLGWGRVVKRFFDLIVGTTLLIIAAPLMFIIAILIKLSDGGPVFLRQTRLTRFNQEFKVFKFRTHNIKYNGLSPEEAFTKMGKPELIKVYRDDGDQLENDPRVTFIGKFLRVTSLDELAQLFNVVRGDISLVGPRALIPQELAAYKKRHTILSVKSGLTGLAQVSGRRTISFDERRKLDLYYVQNWNFWLDITILLKTFRAVITGRGAR